MTTLIGIVCPVSQVEAAQTAVEEGCKETGALLLGHYLYEKTGEVLLMVRPLQATRVSKLVAALSHARQQEVIASFRFMACDLVKISFDPSMNLREQMRDFPLNPGELWFFAIHDPHQAYVCISRPVMGAKQAAWLLEHEVEWAYV